MSEPIHVPEIESDSDSRSRSVLIEDLLSRQDEVIRQLDELDKRLLQTIEEIRPPKVEDQGDSSIRKAA